MSQPRKITKRYTQTVNASLRQQRANVNHGWITMDEWATRVQSAIDVGIPLDADIREMFNEHTSLR